MAKDGLNGGGVMRSLKVLALAGVVLLCLTSAAFAEILFQDDFSTDKGWTYGTNWERGYATGSTGHNTGYPDPGSDHTPADGYVIGSDIGGNIGYPIEGTHGYYWVTSPAIDCGDGSRPIQLSFWRWLNINSDYAMHRRIEVWNGANWIVIAEGGTYQDGAWTYVEFDVTSYANSNFRVRFGYDVGSHWAIMSGWNVDDVMIYTSWERESIGGGSNWRYLQDVNGGDPDIMAGGECTLLRWYVNPGTMQNNWTYYTVYDFSDDVEGIVVKHFGSDAYLDIAVTTPAPDGSSGGVYVLTNPQTESGNWARTTLSSNRRSCMETIAAGDIDGDGWNDVVFANRQPFVDTYLYWFENPQGGGSWTRRTIDTLSNSHLKGRHPEVADIDLDGDADVICYHYGDRVTYWYGNNGSGTSWTENRIYGTNISYKGIGDVDDDGDTDIICSGNWHFNEGEGTTAEDSSPCSNDGTLTNMDTDTCWVDGKIGKALDFDGVNDYVNCGNDASLNMGTSDFTIEAWVKTSKTTGEQAFIGKKAGGGSAAAGYALNIYNSKPHLYFSDGTNQATGDLGGTVGFVNNGEWHHWAAVFDRSDVFTLYIDGNPFVNTKNLSSVGSVNNSTNFYIGAGISNSSYLLDGVMDEVRIYSRALTEDEIYEHYQEGL